MYKLMKWRKGILQRRLVREIRSCHSMVEAVPTQGLFNHKCFDNAVQYHTNHPSFGVVECIYVDDGYPVLHYLNVKGALYYETTLGWRAKYHEYYIIRTIHPDDYKRIDCEFDVSLKYWYRKYTTWFDRNILGISRIL